MASTKQPQLASKWPPGIKILTQTLHLHSIEPSSLWNNLKWPLQSSLNWPASGPPESKSWPRRCICIHLSQAALETASNGLYEAASIGLQVALEILCCLPQSSVSIIRSLTSAIYITYIHTFLNDPASRNIYPSNTFIQQLLTYVFYPKRPQYLKNSQSHLNWRSEFFKAFLFLWNFYWPLFRRIWLDVLHDSTKAKLI